MARGMQWFLTSHMSSSHDLGAVAPTAFTFASAGHLAAADLQSLEKTLRSFSAGLSRQFSDSLGIPLLAEFGEMRELSLEDYRNTLVSGAYALMFRVLDKESEAAVEFDSLLVSALLELLLGGGSASLTALQRSLTPLEARLLSSIQPLL